MRARRTIGIGIGALALLALLVGACSDDDSGDEASGGDTPVAEADFAAATGFVGELEGTDAYVAVVAGQETVEVYACDGESGIAERFTGEVDDPTEFTLTNDAGGEATVEFADGAFAGDITLADGSTHAFATEAAEGDAGLYHPVDPPEDVRAGWVVLNDGSQRGSFGGVASGGGYIAAPKLPPGGGTVRFTPPGPNQMNVSMNTSIVARLP